MLQIKFVDMFILKDPNKKFPELYPRVERKDPTVSDKGYVKVGDFMLREDIDLIPQQGLQEQVLTANVNVMFAVSAASAGKCLPIDEVVLTPNGWVTMGELKVGDTITSSNGKPQYITEIHEEGVKDMYELKTHDNSKCVCSADHLWLVNERKPHYKAEQKIVQFQKIKDSLDGKDNYSYSLPIMEGEVEYAKSNVILPIPPYIMGLLLGNGCFTDKISRILFSTTDEFVKQYLRDRYGLYEHPNGKDFAFRDGALKQEIIDLGLYNKRSYEKFIPTIYQYASIGDRWELLRGLMDTDGSIDNCGGCEYSTSSEQFGIDVQNLVRGLGGYCKMSSRIPKFTHKGEKREGKRNYRIFIRMLEPHKLFKTPYKLHRAETIIRSKRRDTFNRPIVGYNYVGKKQCRCITVSSPDMLFITRDYIVTHNSFSGIMRAIAGVGMPNYTARIVVSRLQDTKKGSSTYRDFKFISDFGGCEFSGSDYPIAYWEKYNNAIQAIHLNFNTFNPAEWDACKEYLKANQAIYFYWDELTTTKDERPFMYSLSRNRDASGLTPCTFATFNATQNHFTYDWLLSAGYIDLSGMLPRLRKDMVGVVKYFYNKGTSVKDMIWGWTREEVAEKAGIEITETEKALGLTALDMIKSFTVLTGEAADNKILVNRTKGGSIANLHNVGEKDRLALKETYFTNNNDDETLNLTTAMIHNLWSNPADYDDNTMYAALDVSDAGLSSDGAALVILKGKVVVAIEEFNGNLLELEGWVKTKLNDYKVSIYNFAFDANGIGRYLKSYTNGYPIIPQSRCIPMVDENGNTIASDTYNTRSQLLAMLESMIVKGELNISVPKLQKFKYNNKGAMRELIEILSEDIALFRSKKVNTKTYYYSKDEFKSKYKRSPNITDALSYAMVFFILKREKKTAPEPIPETAYNGIGRRFSGGYIGKRVSV